MVRHNKEACERVESIIILFQGKCEDDMVSSYGILLVPVHKLWEGGTEKVRYDNSLTYTLLESFWLHWWLQSCIQGCLSFPYCIDIKLKMIAFKYLLNLFIVVHREIKGIERQTCIGVKK